jgi:hypothetical protein
MWERFIKILNKWGLLQKKKEGIGRMEPSYLKVRGSWQVGVADGRKQECKEEDRQKDLRRWNRQTQMEPGVA